MSCETTTSVCPHGLSFYQPCPRCADDFVDGLVEDMDDDRDYLVTATVQIVVRAQNEYEARTIMKEDLSMLIEMSDYANEPTNGSTVDSVEELPDGLGGCDGCSVN